MIKREIILNYYNYGETYYGSYKGLRFAIAQAKGEEDVKLRISAWPEPFCYDKTDKEDMTVEEFPFTEEGYDLGITWLNLQYKGLKDKNK